MINQSGNLMKHDLSFNTTLTQTSRAQTTHPDHFRVDTYSHHSRNCQVFLPRLVFEERRDQKPSLIKKLHVMEDDDLRTL